MAALEFNQLNVRSFICIIIIPFRRVFRAAVSALTQRIMIGEPLNIPGKNVPEINSKLNK